MEEPAEPKPKTRDDCMDVVVSLRCTTRLKTREEIAEHLPVLVGLIIKRAFDRDESVKSLLVERSGVELVLNVRNALAWMSIRSWREWDRLLEATFPEPRAREDWRKAFPVGSTVQVMMVSTNEWRCAEVIRHDKGGLLVARPTYNGENFAFGKARVRSVVAAYDAAVGLEPRTPLKHSYQVYERGDVVHMDVRTERDSVNWTGDYYVFNRVTEQGWAGLPAKTSGERRCLFTKVVSTLGHRYDVIGVTRALLEEKPEFVHVSLLTRLAEGGELIVVFPEPRVG